MCCPNCCLEPDGPIGIKLPQLKAQISFIETMIQRLSSRRFHLLRKANTICHIAKLPADVLIKIFQITCESTENTDTATTPLLFGGICKDWREIAWSTPLLWSMVSIKVSKRPAQVDLLREWLLRAQSTQLSIYLTLDEERERRPEPFRAIFELLVTRLEYWRTFDSDLLLPPAEYLNMLQYRQYPSLTSLSLRVPPEHFFPTMFLVAPRLARLEFSGFNLLGCNLETFPLRQLRCINMKRSNINILQALALLRCARALKEYYIDIILQAVTPEPTLHTELEHLYVRNPYLYFLDHLTLPKLRVLTVDNGQSYVGRLIYAPIYSLISRSSCHLERLNAFQRLPFQDDAIITLLEALPSLTHLSLTSIYSYSVDRPEGLTDKLVSRLRALDHGLRLLPRLTSLEYQGPVPCNHRLLVDMLSERWHHSFESESRQDVSRLIRAKIVELGRSPQDRRDDVHTDIDMLVDEGMQVEIRWNP